MIHKLYNIIHLFRDIFDRVRTIPGYLFILGMVYLLLPVASFFGQQILPVIHLPRNRLISADIWNEGWLIVTLLTPIISIGLLRVARWGYFLLILHGILVLIMNSFLLLDNLILGAIHKNIPILYLLRAIWVDERGWIFGIILLANIALVFLVITFLTGRVRALFFSALPRGIRSARDSRRCIEIEIETHGEVFRGKTFDINKYGFFFRLLPDQIVRYGATGTVRLLFDSQPPIEFPLRIARVFKKGDLYRPRGFGANFLSASKEARKAIAISLSTLDLGRSE